MGDTNSYASGNWLVKEGNEEEFVARWNEFLEWTRDNAQGFGGANLIRDMSNPRHFLSFAEWADTESQQAWRSLDEFRQKLGACRELCEDFEGGAFTRATSVNA
jgi:heme-degrading monooxygenase HmoA